MQGIWTVSGRMNSEEFQVLFQLIDFNSFNPWKWGTWLINPHKSNTLTFIFPYTHYRSLSWVLLKLLIPHDETAFFLSHDINWYDGTVEFIKKNGSWFIASDIEFPLFIPIMPSCRSRDNSSICNSLEIKKGRRKLFCSSNLFIWNRNQNLNLISWFHL